MIREFEYKGKWWLPSNSRRRIAGTLRFTASGGVYLDLMGSLTATLEMGFPQETATILGISSEGQEITLSKCFQTNATLGISGFPTSSFYANEAFLGAHFNKIENIKFESWAVNYSYLEEWVNTPAFDVRSSKNKMTIKYSRPQPIEAIVKDGWKISIVAKSTLDYRSNVQIEAGIKQRMYIYIQSPSERPFAEFCDIAYQIQNVLSLAVGQPVYPLTIEGTRGFHEKAKKAYSYRPPVEIFYRAKGISEAPDKLHIPRTFFTFNDISSKRFDYFLKNWFKKADLLKPVNDLYFGTLYNPKCT